MRATCGTLSFCSANSLFALYWPSKESTAGRPRFGLLPLPTANLPTSSERLPRTTSNNTPQASVNTFPKGVPGTMPHFSLRRVAPNLRSLSTASKIASKSAPSRPTSVTANTSPGRKYCMSSSSFNFACCWSRTRIRRSHPICSSTAVSSVPLPFLTPKPKSMQRLSKSTIPFMPSDW